MTDPLDGLKTHNKVITDKIYEVKVDAKSLEAWLMTDPLDGLKTPTIVIVSEVKFAEKPVDAK